MNLPHSWRSAWECARDTAVLAVFIAAMIWLLLFVLPASVGADGPRWDGDWACRPQCGMRPSTGPWGGFGGYLPSTQPLGLFPGAAPLWIPQNPAPVTVVPPQQPGYTVFIVVPPSTPSATPVVTPPASPTSTPTATPAPTVAPAPTVQAPQYQAPAIQPLNCSSLGCAMGTAPDNDTNSDTAPSLTQASSTQTRGPWTETIKAIAPEPYADCLAAINAREDPDGDLHQPNLQGSGATGLFQFLNSTWRGTPTGSQVSLYSASAEDQVNAAIEEIQAGSKAAWSPVPAACAGLRTLLPFSLFPQLVRLAA